MMYKYHNYEKI